MYVLEPVSPVRFVESLLLALPEDLGEVELRRIPAADSVVGAEVALALKVKRGRAVPLRPMEGRKKKRRLFKDIRPYRLPRNTRRVAIDIVKALRILYT